MGPSSANNPNQISNALRVNWSSGQGLSPSGYRITSRNLMLALHQRGVVVHYRNVFDTNDYFPGEDSRITSFRKQPYDLTVPEIVYYSADQFFRNRSKYKIGFTMFEADGIPQGWVNQCNQMNEVWVPSQFNLKTFQSSGVVVPIHVIPLGIDPTLFYPNVTEKRFSDKFTFLAVIDLFKRKNPGYLLEAFAKAFSHDDDVILVCKINRSPGINVYHEIQKLGFTNILSKVKFLHNQVLSDEEMASLYRSADCLVHATRGEGWGMPILEALACGTPVIATNWGGSDGIL